MPTNLPTIEFKNIIYIIALVIFAIYLIHKSSNRLNQASKEELNQCIVYLTMRLKQNSKYRPKSNVYERFQKNNLDPLALTALATDILKHCHFTPAALYVKVNQAGEKNIAGTYKIQGHTSTITINYRQGMREEEIMATLIHECMHFFLRGRNIGYQDKNKNEILTDVTTVYMGFYEYMKNGYGRVGYISHDSIEYVHDTLKKIRQNN